MDEAGGLQTIPLTRIVPSRWQPRGAAFDAERLWELACSIKEHGLINPVVVFPRATPTPALPHKGGGSGGLSHVWYELVAGERRVRATLGLAWAAVDDQVTEKEAVEGLAGGGIAALPDEARAVLDLDAEEGALVPVGAGVNVGWCQVLARVESGETAEELQRLHRLAVVENIERESLSALEEARAMRGQSTLKLLNAVTGKVETFAAVAFEMVRERKDPRKERWVKWPKGFPTPWVREGKDADGNPDEA